jgi:hypothetical protein
LNGADSFVIDILAVLVCQFESGSELWFFMGGSFNNAPASHSTNPVIANVHVSYERNRMSTFKLKITPTEYVTKLKSHEWFDLTPFRLDEKSLSLTLSFKVQNGEPSRLASAPENELRVKTKCGYRAGYFLDIVNNSLKEPDLFVGDAWKKLSPKEFFDRLLGIWGIGRNSASYLCRIYGKFTSYSMSRKCEFFWSSISTSRILGYKFQENTFTTLPSIDRWIFQLLAFSTIPLTLRRSRLLLTSCDSLIFTKPKFRWQCLAFSFICFISVCVCSRIKQLINRLSSRRYWKRKYERTSTSA